MSPGRCPVSVEGSVSRTLGAVVGDRLEARAETTPGPGSAPGLAARPTTDAPRCQGPLFFCPEANYTGVLTAHLFDRWQP